MTTKHPSDFLSDSLRETRQVSSQENSQDSSQQHISLLVSGRVQGVGFRPYVYQLATSLSLRGSVCNTPSGVRIHLQGSLSDLDDFQQKLVRKAPVQARIKSIKNHQHPLTEFSDFRIIESQSVPSNTKLTRFNQPDYSNQISPDIGICDRCLSEFNDPNSRRYQDPFINCSDCGPRFTIMKALPYDRQHSSMNLFQMCEDCQEEYQNPLDRRYHTQGICCPKCGPEMTLYDAQQFPLAIGQSAIEKVAEVLNNDGLVAFKSVGGFHILCDATSDLAVEKLRKRKRRQKKPLAVLCANLKMAMGQGEISLYEQALFTSEVCPIMLFTKNPHNNLTEQVAPDTHRVGLFLAHTPLQHLLFKYFDKPLVATSANLSGDPILYQAEDVFDQLCRPDFELVDYVLDYNREIVNPCDDSVVQTIGGITSVILRLGRGLAPHYGEFKQPKFPVGSVLQKHKRSKKQKPAFLGVGAQQKSSFAFGYQEQWMLSPYIADLHSLASQKRFEHSFHRLNNLMQIPYNQIACDAHPDYASSKWAKSFAKNHGGSLLKVPHHFAHILACMAEFQLRDPVLAFCWDGTGLGNDGTIWGGEVLLSNPQECYRVNHIKPFKLLGGDLANSQPRRIALSLLFDMMPLKTVLEMKLPTLGAFSEFEIHQLYKSYQSNLNAPVSSSMGRVFDAVASLIGLVQNTDYEGQSGQILEALYDAKVTAAYDFEVVNGEIVIEPMLWQIIEDMEQQKPLSEMASQFFNMLVNLVEQAADKLSGFHVMLTGGVFQNKLLLELICQRFETKHQELYFPQHTPINDGAIALGQIWWLLNQLPNDRQLI